MRTEEELINTISIRRTAWDNAKEMTQVVVDENGLEDYPVNSNIFAHGSTMTKVDQHVDAIINVAEWLLEPLT